MAESKIVVDDHVYIISKEDPGDDDDARILEIVPHLKAEANGVIHTVPQVEYFQNGSTFESMQLFEGSLADYMNDTHTIFRIHDSRTSENSNLRSQRQIDTDKFKYAYVRYVCKHFGVSKPNPKTRGLRHHKNSFRIGCPAKFTLSYCHRNENYQIVKGTFHHNHPIGPQYNILYPERRRLSDQEAEDVKALLKSKLSPKMIINRLNLHDKVTEKDLKNFKAKLKLDPDTKITISKCARPPLPYSDMVGLPKAEHKAIGEVTISPSQIAAVNEDDALILGGDDGEEEGGHVVELEDSQLEQEEEDADDNLLSTEVFDILSGRPAANLVVEVWLLLPHNGTWVQLSVGTTDKHGRCTRLLSAQQMTVGNYKLIFNSQAYFKKQKKQSIFPHIELEMELKDQKCLHVPLQMSPNGYTTSCIQL